MSDVYSTQLGAAASVGALPVTMFTVPAGYRAVIVTISAVTGINALLTYWFAVHHPSGAKIASASHSTGTTDFTNDLLSGRWVCNPGESVDVQTDGALYDFFCSGFLLRLP